MSIPRNPVTDAVTAELDRHGIPWTYEHRGKHGAILFDVSGRERFYIVPGTPSDGRAPMNAVSQVRRMLGLSGRRRKGERRQRDTCRVEVLELPEIAVGGPGMDALWEHPHALEIPVPPAGWR